MANVSRNITTSPLMFESDDENTLADSSGNDSEKVEAFCGNDTIVKSLSKEEKILKGFQTVLMGIPPPPAFTVPQLDSREMLKMWRDNQKYRLVLSPDKGKNKEANTIEETAKSAKWPHALEVDQWDIYYNKNKVCEEMERLSLRYKERYVGAETSSCINALYVKSPSRTASARKRARTRMWGHSPGRRLSHLARRRKAFSSASLSLCSVAGNNNPDKRMIMVEKKKIGNRQKKNSSVKKTKPTPKKKNQLQASTFKRALFQSPDQLPTVKEETQTPDMQCIQRSKRNLFVDTSCDKLNENGKRERPVVRRVSPRKRVNRTLSFQESAAVSDENSMHSTSSAQQRFTDTMLSGAHKQKMLWAVTNALREEGMKSNHELFRPCMSVLFKACQKLWLTSVAKLNQEGSTSENMFALTKQFSAYVIKHIRQRPSPEHMAAICADIVKMGEHKQAKAEDGSESSNHSVTKSTEVEKSNTAEDNTQNQILKESPRRSGRNCKKSNAESSKKEDSSSCDSNVIVFVSKLSPLKQYSDKENIQANVISNKLKSPFRRKSSDLRIKCLKNLSQQSPNKEVSCLELEQPKRVTRSKSCDTKSVLDTIKDNTNNKPNLQTSTVNENEFIYTEEHKNPCKKDNEDDKNKSTSKTNFEESVQKSSCNEKVAFNESELEISVRVTRRRSSELADKEQNHLKENKAEEVYNKSDDTQNILNHSLRKTRTPNKKRNCKDLKDESPSVNAVPGLFLSPQNDFYRSSQSNDSSIIVITKTPSSDSEQVMPVLYSEKVINNINITSTDGSKSVLSDLVPKTTSSSGRKVFPTKPCSRILRSNSKNSPLKQINQNTNNSVCFVKLHNLESSKEFYEERPEATNKTVQSSCRQLATQKPICAENIDSFSSEGNTPSQLVGSDSPFSEIVPGETSNRTLQLYKLSNSGGEQVVLAGLPKLVPHWEQEYEVVESVESTDVDTPPSLRPHWESPSGSGIGTSCSLPESIMAHWQKMSTGFNSSGAATSDKIMFDFEDSSYEIAFPSNDDDSRASSICAPLDLPNVIDDSRSGFYTFHRKDSTESCQW